MTRNAVIIDNIKDAPALMSRFDPKNTLFLTDRYQIMQQLGDEKVKYFFVPSEDGSKELRAIYHFGAQWYRDAQGHDLTFQNGISVGQILARRLMFIAANDYRNYQGFKRWVDQVDLIHISKSQSRSFKSVASLFGQKIQWYNSLSQDPNPYESSPDRAQVYDALSEHPCSKVVRWVQKWIPQILNKKKILHMSDWTSFGLAKKRKDLILTYTYRFWKGAYFLFKKEFQAAADRIFPKEVPQSVIAISHLKCVMEESGITWDESFLQLISNTIQKEYQAAREIYLKTHAFYKELFVNYRPSLITFPGENHFTFMIGMQIAKEMGIPTMLIVDGYSSYDDQSLLYWDQDQKKTLVDYFATFGRAHHDVVVESGVAAKNCILMKPTILHKYDMVSLSGKKIYDAIIMDYSPHLINPYARLDMRSKIVTDILRTLLELGFKHIAIKTKPYFSRENELEELLRFLDKNNLKNTKIEIITGQLFEHLPKTKCVVGQISTALLETTYLDIPYYVYEPVENGKCDWLINTSKILNRNSIARSTEELKLLIAGGKTSITADRDYLFSGPSFESVAMPGSPDIPLKTNPVTKSSIHLCGQST